MDIINQIRNAICALEAGDTGSTMSALKKAEKIWVDNFNAERECPRCSQVHIETIHKCHDCGHEWN